MMSISKGYFDLVSAQSVEPERTLLLISTATNGPARTPFRLREGAYPEDVLGDSPLYHAYDMARQAGATDIILYRLNGEHATQTLNGMVYDMAEGIEIEKPILSLRSVSASEACNKIRFVLAENTMTVYDEVAEVQRVYRFDQHETAKRLVDAINLDAAHGLVAFEAVVHEPTFRSLNLRELNTIVQLSGGQTEEHLIEERALHIEELNQRLLIALYSELPYDQENYIINSELGMMSIGVVSVSCLYHDDGVNLSETMGRFCYQKSVDIGQGCMSVIGVSPIPNPTIDLIRTKIDQLILMRRAISFGGAISLQTPQVFEAEEATWESHVQVVLGDGIRYISNGNVIETVSLAPSYAGLQSSLPVQSSTTNKQIGGFGYLSYELDKEDVDNLLGNGYISIIRSVRKGFVPYAETTYVNKPNSILRSAHAIRISHFASRRLAEMLDYSIGNRVTPMSRRDMMTTTSDLVARLLTTDLVKNYELGFVHSTERQGSMSVQLEITPHSQVRAVTSLVKLPFIQGGS